MEYFTIDDFKKSLQGPIAKLLSVVGSELNQIAKNRLLEYQINEYKRNYFTKTLLHRSEPIKLMDFYIPLNIQDTPNQNNNCNRRISTKCIKTLFKESNYITLIGSAGSGKSTIVKYLFIDSVQNKFKIPIKIELRHLNEYTRNLNDYIFDEIFLFYKLGFSKEIIDRLLSSGEFAFFFDGYDEINSIKKQQITKDIDSFVNKYGKNYYLITSRPYTNIDALPLFKNYYVCQLLESEIPAFINKQIPKSELELANRMIKAISKLHNNSFRAFLSNPLLLSMFILTYQSYSELPQNKSEFYRQVFDTLYSIHDSISKLSFVREKQSGLTKNGFENVLKLFSFISYFEEKFTFAPEYLDKILTTIKDKKKDITFDNEKLIDDLQVAIGILTKDGISYTFPHRSLQEYFAANYIINLRENNKKNILNKIKDNISKRIFYIVDNYNFISLLVEQDYNTTVKEIVLPLLKQERDRIFLIDLNQYDINYNIQVKIYLIMTQILNLNIRKEKISLEFTGENKPKVIRISGNENYFISVDQLEVNGQYMRNDIYRVGAFIKKNINLWIDDIKRGIDESENSDTEIMDII